MFPIDNFQRLRSIVGTGIEKLDSEQRKNLLDILVHHPTGLQLRVDIVEDDARSHGLFSQQPKNESKQVFSSEQIENAALAIRGQIAKACEDGSIWDAPLPTFLMWNWQRMEGGEVFKQWMKRVIAHDDLVVRLADQLPRNSYKSSSNEGRQIIEVFKSEEWRNLFNVEEFFRRLEDLSLTSEKAKASLKRLREAEVNTSR